MLFRTLTVLALAGLVACAPVTKRPTVNTALAALEAEKQRELVVEERAQNSNRLHRIAYPILKENVDLCDDIVTAGSGLYAVNKYSYSTEYRAAAAKVLDLGAPLSVASVAKNSAGDKAGFLAGDLLIAMNGKDLPVGSGAMKKTAELFQDIAKKSARLSVEIRRNGKSKTLVIKPDQICDYGYSIQQKDIVNAFADGENIFITTGMMRFIESDEELALVVGHEIAHNQMGHITKKTGNAALGLVVDLLFAGIGVDTQGTFTKVAGSAYSQEFESEADYVGLYMSARAKFPISDAAKFWRRMAVAHPGSIKENHGASHPSTPERFVALEKTADEIKAKQGSGLPLLPEMEEE